MPRMLKRLLWLIVLITVACSRANQTPTPTPTAAPVGPEPDPTAQNFLDAWTKADYVSMFNLLSNESQARVFEPSGRDFEVPATPRLWGGG